MSAVLDHHAGHGHADDHAHGHPHGWRRWLFATNHKDIGTMYLLFSFAMLMVGGVLALGICAELFQPGLQFVNPQLFNQFTTMKIAIKNVKPFRFIEVVLNRAIAVDKPMPET